MLRVLLGSRSLHRRRAVKWTNNLLSVLDGKYDEQCYERNVINNQQRFYGITPRRENPLIYGGIAVFVLGASAQVGLQAYEEYQAHKAKKAQQQADDVSNSKANATDKKSDTSGENQKSEEGEASEDTGESFFSRIFATTYYEGGFEDKMTRREAALILGVRESANEKRIKDAHRRILVKNHPDKGGSPYVASKINEAKDFLLKGKT